MTIGGLDSSKGSSNVSGTNSTADIRKRLAEANQTVADAKSNKTKDTTDENELQTLELSETDDTSKISKTVSDANSKINDSLSSAEEKYNDQIKQCQEQLKTLQEQLKNINEQQRALTREISQGGDIAQLQSSFSQLNSQKNQIYDSINTVLLNISSIEKSIAASKTLASDATNSNSMMLQDVLGGTGSADGSMPLVRSDAIKTGNAVIDFAEQFDDKSASEMASIMQNNGSAYHQGAWCADFVTFALKNAYGKDNVPGNFINTCSNTAYCPTIMSWAKSNGSFATSPNSVQPGDLVLFDWDGDGTPDHVGLFRGRNSDGSIATIEGNTSGAAGGSCVENKNRAQGTIIGYVWLSALR